MRIYIFITFVVILLLSGKFLVAQTSPGNISSESRISQGMQSPLRIAIDRADRIYVTDPFIKSLKQFDLSGNLNADYTLNFTPVSVAVNAENKIFVGNATDGKVYLLNADGSTVAFYSGTQFPSSMVFASDKNLYIADSKLRQVFVVDPSGVLVRIIGENMFAFPTGITYDHKNNRILVAEHGGAGNNSQMKVNIFSLTGTLLNSFGSYGGNNGQFFRSQGLTVGKCGYIYIPEPVQGYVNVFSEDGVFITRFSQYGENAGSLKVPMDVVFDSQERIIATSLNNGVLEIFNITDSLPSSNLSNTDISLCAGNTATVPVKLKGTAPWSFTYTIDGLNPQTVTNTFDNPHILSVNQSGTLKISALSDARYAGTCFTESARITINPLPTAAITTVNISISTGQPAEIPVTFTGTAPWNFTYTRNGAPVSVNNITSNPYILTVLQDGIYEITALSDAHCTGTNFTGIVTVDINTLPTSTIVSDDTLIQTGTSANILIAFTGTAPWNFTYTVDGANPVNIANVATSPYLLYVNEAGTYRVSNLTDANFTGTFMQGNTTVTIQPLPTAVITSGNVSICQGSSTNISIDLTGTPPWNLTYTENNLNPIIVANITANPYLITIENAGTYQISSLADAYFSGTSFTGSASVTVNPIPVATITSGNAYTCAGNSSDVVAELTGTAPWTVTYTTSGANPATVSNIVSSNFTIAAFQSGLYEIQSVADANCTGNSSGNAYITVHSLPSSNLTSGNVFSCSGEYAMIPVQFTGISPWTFTFTQDGLSPLTITNISENPYNLFVIEAGNYALTSLTDAYCTGSSISGNSMVTLNSLPTSAITNGDKTICSGTLADININFTGIPPFTFSYTVNGLQPTVVTDIATASYTLSVSQPGIYEVVALSDAICNGNVFAGSATISNHAQTSSTITAASPMICPGSSTEVQIALTGNAPWNFSYATPSNGTVEVFGNTTNPFVINTAQTGSYEVIALSDLNCTGTSLFGSVTLTENVLPAANIVSSDVSVCPGSVNDIAIEFTGTAPWSFEYLKDGVNPVVVSDISVNSYSLPVSDAGIYSLHLLSDANCQNININATVAISPIATVTAGIETNNEVICPGTTASLNVTFTGTAPWNFTYTRDGENPVNVNNITQNNVSIPLSSEGSYQAIAVSDANCTGTTFTGLKNVAYNIPSSNIVSGNVVICSGTNTDLAVELLGKAPWSFSYAKDGQTLSTVSNVMSNTYFLPVSAEGTYVITSLTDSMCAGVYMYGSSTITFKPMPSSTIAESGITACEGNTADINIDFTGTAPWSFTYTKDGLNPVSVSDINSSNYILPVSESGTYAIAALNDANCAATNIASTAVVNINSLPVVNLGADIVTCSNIPVTLDAGAGFASYLWNDATANQILSVNAAGTYNVQVTDLNGCINTDAVVVAVNSLPVVSLGADISFCQGQSAMLDAGAGFASYLWNDASANQILSVNAAGTYNVQVTDLNGCTNTDEIIVSLNLAPVPSFTFTANSLDVNFINNSQNANSYLWDFGDGQSSSIFSPAHLYAVSGTYLVSLTASSPPCNDSIYSQTLQIIEVGMGNIGLNNTIKIYPNPSSGKVTISVANNPSAMVQVMIYNAIGQEIYTTLINGANAMQEIDLSHHAAGIYNVKIVSNGISKSIKLVRE